MKYREFGAGGIRVSEVCYGTWRYANPEGFADERSREGAAALREALQRGVNFVHSSHEYGTRWITGDVLRQYPDRHELHHIIKVNEPDFGELRFDRRKFRAQIEDALRELHAEHISIVQHLQRGSVSKDIAYTAAADETRIAEFRETADDLREEFTRLKQEGKVQALASFPYTFGFAREAVTSGIYDGLVAYFNVLETEWLDLFPAMAERGMGFVGIRPFCAGLLTDRRVDRSTLAEDDRLRTPNWDGKYDQLNHIRNELDLRPKSWTEYALQFALMHPLIASTAVSINSRAQLADVLSATEDSYLDKAQLEQIHRLNKAHLRMD